MEIMWNREKVTWKVNEMLRGMIIGTVTWTLMTVVPLKRTRRNWVRLEVLHTFDADGKIF